MRFFKATFKTHELVALGVKTNELTKKLKYKCPLENVF